METTTPTPQTKPSIPVLPRERLMSALSNEARLIILNELCNGEPLGVVDFAPKTGLTLPATSKHCAVLAALGIIVRGRGNLYRLAPAFQPAPGTRTIDFGHCLLRLDWQSAT